MAGQIFRNLPEEKQQEILYASLYEFSQNGYDLASTNRIVERAGISKGVLFKYFGNKEGLFMYVFDVYANKVTEATWAEPAELPPDFLEAIKLLALKKIKFFRENPLASRLFLRAAQRQEHPVYQKALLKVDSEKGQQIMQYLVMNLLLKDLRPGVSPEKVMMLIHWVSEGLRAKFLPHQAELPNDDELETFYEEIVREMDSYFDLIKQGIYRSI